MAATKISARSVKSKINNITNPALRALTGTALLLPGLGSAGEGDEFSFQYGHYQESDRKYFATNPFDIQVPLGTFSEVEDKLDPIEVDSLAASARVSITDRLKFTFNFTQDTWAGATPIATAPAVAGGNTVILDDTFTTVIGGASPYLGSGQAPFFDTQGNPLALDLLTFPFVAQTNSQLTHVMVSASPETRNQMDMQLSYEWDEAALDIGGGVSVERDYESHFINLGGRWDFNRKLTSLSLGGSYTSSDIKALIDPDAQPYFFTDGYDDLIFQEPRDTENQLRGNNKTLQAERQDWSINLGLSQVLYKDAHFTTGLGYTQSRGFLENPYKATLIYTLADNPIFGTNYFPVTARAFLEQRPELRRQFTWDFGYVQFVPYLNAALHFDYQFYMDDWGIDAHTFSGEWVQPLGFGWKVAPRIRYYSQTAADFYTPFLMDQGPVVETRDVLQRAPEHFSSDHRLSAFGTLSWGFTLSKEFTKGVKLEGGFEYYMHRGSLTLDGEGEGDYADFDYWAFNAGLSVNLSALSRGGSDIGAHTQHAEHHGHAPAGVMFAHMLDKAGQFMVGYRYKHSRRHGSIMHGKNAVSDQEVHSNACPGEPLGCRVKPSEMEMSMHMLNLMYAPTNWMNLMLMPQFVTKSMNMHSLNGIPISTGSTNDQDPLGQLYYSTLHGGHQHETGSLGDIGMFVLFKLVDFPNHRLHISFGATAPTGDVDEQLKRVHRVDIGFNHYGMQTGSGTWDLKPGVTYTGNSDDFFWGAQVTGIYRLGLNESGFAFGNNLQATAWGGYQIFNWLSASIRGVYSVEGDLKGEYPEDAHIPIGPMDQPQNYGGKFWDLGMGLQASIPNGDLAGNSLSIEYLQPLVDDYNGYQLEREGTLVINWSYLF